MRVLYLLMAAILLASFAAASPTPLTQDKKFLRRLDEEERAGGNVNKADDLVDKVVSILADKMADDIPSMVKMFKRWKGHTMGEVLKTPAGAVLARASNERFMKMFNLYGEYSLLGAEAFIKQQRARIAKAARR